MVQAKAAAVFGAITQPRSCLQPRNRSVEAVGARRKPWDILRSGEKSPRAATTPTFHPGQSLPVALLLTADSPCLPTGRQEASTRP